MKAVVIGLGSMGKRRVRLINQYDTGMEIIGVDSNVERRAESEAVFGIKTCAPLAESGAMEGDAALVCSSPLSHASLITDCLNRKMHVFTELNLVMDRYDENISLEKKLHAYYFFRLRSFTVRKTNLLSMWHKIPSNRCITPTT